MRQFKLNSHQTFMLFHFVAYCLLLPQHEDRDGEEES